MQTINKQLVARCFSQARQTYNQQAIAQQQIHRDLLQLLLKYTKGEFRCLLEIGCGTGQLTELLSENLQVEHWHLNDLCNVETHIAQILKSQPYHFYQQDAEHYAFPTKYDLIVSASTLQWFDNPIGFVQNCAERLTANGYLLLSTFAPDNLHQIRQLTDVGLNYPSLQQWQVALADKFDVLILQQQQIELCFDSPLAVLQHLKQTGVTGLVQQHWSKAKLQQFIANYQRFYLVEQGKVGLTYQPIFMLLKNKN